MRHSNTEVQTNLQPASDGFLKQTRLTADKTSGELNPKYPGGIPALKKLLRHEGHKVVQRGKKFLVENFQERLLVPRD